MQLNGSCSHGHGYLDCQPFHLVLERPNLTSEVAGFVARDASSDDGPGDATGAAESELRSNINIWCYSRDQSVLKYDTTPSPLEEAAVEGMN